MKAILFDLAALVIAVLCGAMGFGLLWSMWGEIQRGEIEGTRRSRSSIKQSTSPVLFGFESVVYVGLGVFLIILGVGGVALVIAELLNPHPKPWL